MKNNPSTMSLPLSMTRLAKACAITAVSLVASLTISASAAHAASYVYVANEDSHDVSVFSLNQADGALKPIETQSVGGIAMPMAVSPDQSRLYVGVRTAPFRVATFGIDPATGKLTSLGTAPLAASMAYLSTDKTGSFLFSASYGGNQFSVNPIGRGGIVGAPQQSIPTGPMSHSIMPSPDNRFVFGAILGEDKWVRFAFDSATGKLSDETVAYAPPGKSGPRFFHFSPDHRFVYLIDELDAKVHVLAYDAQQGSVHAVQTVSALPADFGNQVPWGSDVHLTPNGKYLYASERRSSTLAGFSVNAKTGELTRIGTWESETQTRGFDIDPTGRYLLSVGEKSGHLSAYRIQSNGQLQKIGRYATGDGPNWVEIVDFPLVRASIKAVATSQSQ
jgi:6-phosphogluconolactonase